MSNKLSVIPPVSPESWAMIQSIAPVAQASRMFSVTQEQAAIVMLKGHELGIGIAAAFEFIHVIDGKPSISPKGALALIHNSGKLAALRITDGEGFCEVYMKRTNGFEYTCRFTMADAEKAGLIKDKGNWDKYPANMLRWRAIGYCADVVFPDVLGGMIRPEELGAVVNAEGAPVVVEVLPVAPPVPPAPAPPAQTPHAAEMSVADILNAGFSAEQIVVANEGRIPATSEDCTRVLAKLQAGG